MIVTTTVGEFLETFRSVFGTTTPLVAVPCYGQPIGSNFCGVVVVIAWLVDFLLFDEDIMLKKYDADKLRKHLYSCLTSTEFQRLPEEESQVTLEAELQHPRKATKNMMDRQGHLPVLVRHLLEFKVFTSWEFFEGVVKFMQEKEKTNP